VPYQVKFRSARARLSFTEIAPFLGVTDRASDRLVVTKANALAEDAVRRDGLRTLIAVRRRPLASWAFEGITTRSPGMWVKSTSPHWLW